VDAFPSPDAEFQALKDSRRRRWRRSLGAARPRQCRAVIADALRCQQGGLRALGTSRPGERTEGNPLFVNQFCSASDEEGGGGGDLLALDHDLRRWVMGSRPDRRQGLHRKTRGDLRVGN